MRNKRQNMIKPSKNKKGVRLLLVLLCSIIIMSIAVCGAIAEKPSEAASLAARWEQEWGNKDWWQPITYTTPLDDEIQYLEAIEIAINGVLAIEKKTIEMMELYRPESAFMTDSTRNYMRIWRISFQPIEIDESIDPYTFFIDALTGEIVEYSKGSRG